MLKAFRMLATAALVAGAGTSHAQISWQYSFGNWLGSTPSYQPAETFATLSVSTFDHRSFAFTLNAFDPNGAGTLATAFGPAAFISKIVFNTASGDAPMGISNVQTNGYVANLSLGTGPVNIHGIVFDFFDCFNNCGFGASSTLQAGEWVSWQLDFAESQEPLLSAPSAALNVRNWHHGGVSGGWYTPSFQTAPVPEPETYAMLLAGLGLMAFVARRRQRNLGAH